MRSLIFFVVTFAFSLSATAQYVWLDQSGRKVFSDQPPPLNIPIKRVLQEPGKSTVSLSTSESSQKISEEGNDKSKAVATTTSPNASKDKDLEAAKKKIEEDLAIKKKIELEAANKIKIENCVRAKQAKATLDSGIRLSHTNAKGERGFMDEKTRVVESKRLEGIITTDCN